MALVPKKRRQCTWKDRFELREAYAFTGTVAGALDAVNAAHESERGWIPLSYQHATKAKQHDARIGARDDWDIQAPNIRRKFIEESEKRLGKKALDITAKLLERAEDTVDHPSYRIKGSVATEINTSVKTARLLAEKPTEITGIGDVAAWWSGLDPQQQRDELSRLGVDVSQFDEPEADTAESGDGSDSAEAKSGA